jgi:S1-C subfamily serine protease
MGRMNENEWIRRAQRGDARAVEALYRSHADRVYTVVRRLAADVVLRANGHPVEDVRELRLAVTRAERREVSLEVVRKRGRRELKLRWE